MSDYYKKIIKESKNDEKQKYYDNKEDFDMSYKDKKHDDCCDHDHKCKKHDDCCDHDHKCKKHKKEKSIFTELVVDEHSSTTAPPTSANGTPVPLNSLAQVKIDVDDADDEILLQGTVEWTPNDITIGTLLFALLADLAIPLGVEGTFRIWRSCDHGPATQIFETDDTSIIAGLDLAGLVAGPLTFPLSTVTTSFHWVDKNPCCGFNRYFLTLDLALTTDPLVPPGTGELITVATLLSDILGPLRFSTGTVVFTAAEIEDED